MQYQTPILELRNIYQTPLLVDLAQVTGVNVCLTAGFVSELPQVE